MTRKFLRPGLAALGLVGGLAAAVLAQPAPQPQIIRWPGGWLSLDGPDVILRQSGGAGSSTVVTGSGNGVGNRIVVDNGTTPGLTVLRNVRNGVGNTLTVTPGGPVVELTDRKVYPGRGAKFWSKKEWSDEFDCHLYWCPKSERWYRYDKPTDTYLSVPSCDDPPPAK